MRESGTGLMSNNVRETGSQALPKDSDWLLRFLPEFERAGRRVLDAGCGTGMDSRRLCRAGFAVVAFDRAPLAAAAAEAPGAMLLRADLGRPLPFRDGVFDGVVASLSLHYLPWRETRAAFAELRRVMRAGGPFLFRVNATDDVHHGAGEGERLEPNFYRTPRPSHSETKRFFDEAMVRAAIEGVFTVERLEHQEIHRYELPKQVWECLARAT